MRADRGWAVRRLAAFALAAVGVCVAAGQAPTAKGACTRAVIEVELKAGEGTAKPLGNGLAMMLEPLPSGWILRVVPANGPRGPHDYAELATPPYRSVSPLLLSTDFSFRAQDAVAWNPRRFHFAADAVGFARLSAAYAELTSTSQPSPQVQGRLAELAAKTPEGTIRILDARLVPGTADQTQAAEGVAAHFSTTAHTIERPPDGKATPLGQLTRIRLRVSFDVPASFRPAPGVPTERRPCLESERSATGGR